MYHVQIHGKQVANSGGPMLLCGLGFKTLKKAKETQSVLADAMGSALGVVSGEDEYGHGYSVRVADIGVVIVIDKDLDAEMGREIQLHTMKVQKGQETRAQLAPIR